MPITVLYQDLQLRARDNKRTIIHELEFADNVQPDIREVVLE